GDACRAAGDPGAARAAWQEALDLLAGPYPGEAGAVAARLRELGPAPTHAAPGAIAVPGGGRGSVGKGAARWAAAPVREGT
ncbi:MAG TPA: hypothetical protein VK586_09135, partial [Streptosporangiaceae bacterium]|nr:hypothetical protein [Streptosporangiaceae bacterium]